MDRRRWATAALAAAVVLLAIADGLAFHDLFEPHTVRDWLMLAGSILVFAGFVATVAPVSYPIRRRR